MTREEVKTLLRRPRSITNAIQRKKEQADALKASLLPMGIRYDSDRVMTSPTDRMADVMAEIDRLEREIRELAEEKPRAVRESIYFIEKLSDQQAEVMTLYFVAEKKVRQIARQLHYSEQNVYKIIQRGFTELMKE